MKLSLSAPAKINLYLKILGKRADGYHELETLIQKVSLYDELEVSLVAEPGVRLRCQDATLPEDEGNIAVRAAHLFLARTGNCDQGIHITLKKNIPVAAGLGGGSSDAATVLKGLNQLLHTGCSTEELAAMGVELGADVPLFIYDFPSAWATGIGERLKPAASLSSYNILLVNPGIAVPTSRAYAVFSKADKRSLTSTGKGDILFRSCSCHNNDEFQPDDLKNDLERVIVEEYNVIGELKRYLLAAGAAGAMMSGSGSTVFGLFDNKTADQTETCCQELKKKYDQVYLVSPLVEAAGVG